MFVELKNNLNKKAKKSSYKKFIFFIKKKYLTQKFI